MSTALFEQLLEERVEVVELDLLFERVGNVGGDVGSPPSRDGSPGCINEGRRQGSPSTPERWSRSSAANGGRSRSSLVRENAANSCAFPLASSASCGEMGGAKPTLPGSSDRTPVTSSDWMTTELVPRGRAWVSLVAMT